MPIGLPGWWLIAGWIALAASAGACMGASRGRRALSSLLVGLLLALPFAAPLDERLARGLVGLGAMLAVMRRVEAARTSRSPPLPWALLFVLPIDVPSLRAMPPRLAGDAIARALVHALVTGLGLGVVWLSRSASSVVASAALRWLGGALFFYGYLDVAASGARAGLAALGLDVTPMQRDPILSRSVAEHWGARWNLVVSGWLRRFVFAPVARRSRSITLGVCASFAWSAMLHAFFILASLGAWPALAMGSYFVLQCAALLLEERLELARLPSPLARAWTVLAVLGPSPLFVEPGLTMLGLR